MGPTPHPAGTDLPRENPNAISAMSVWLDLVKDHGADVEPLPVVRRILIDAHRRGIVRQPIAIPVEALD